MRMKVQIALFTGALLAFGGFSLQSHAQKVKPEVVLDNLSNPTGVAAHPKTGHVFIADLKGVHHYSPKSGKAKLIIGDYPEDIYGKGPKYKIGPLGLAFAGAKHLVVADGSRDDPKELVRVYQISRKSLKKMRKESDAEYTLGPIGPGKLTAKGEGNFYGVAVGAGAIFVTANGDDTKGWVAKSVLKKGKPGPLTLAIATKKATNVDAPVPITFTPDKKKLVVGQMGEISIPGDALLTFYNPKSGKLLKSYKTGLNDLTGLAYSPSGKLYATDFSWVDTSKGGLYRLDMKGDSVTPVKLATLDKPTSLGFDKDGSLYITVIGAVEKGKMVGNGKLLVVKGDL